MRGQRVLTDQQLEAITDALTSPGARTYKQIATQLGVSISSLYRVKNRIEKRTQVSSRKIRTVPPYKSMVNELREELLEARREIRELKKRNGATAKDTVIVKPDPRISPRIPEDDEYTAFKEYQKFKAFMRFSE